MTRARNGAASVAPVRAPRWHVVPDDDDRGPSRTFPSCRDGDELLARVNGEVVTVTVDRRRGVAFRTEDGEAVEPEAIAVPPRGYRPSKHSAADRRAAGRVALQVWITPEQKRRLEWIKTEDGFDFATIVGCHIDQEYEGRKGER